MHEKDTVPASTEIIAQNVLIKWENKCKKTERQTGNNNNVPALIELIAQHVISDKLFSSKIKPTSINYLSSSWSKDFQLHVKKSPNASVLWNSKEEILWIKGWK